MYNVVTLNNLFLGNVDNLYVLSKSVIQMLNCVLVFIKILNKNTSLSVVVFVLILILGQVLSLLFMSKLKM